MSVIPVSVDVAIAWLIRTFREWMIDGKPLNHKRVYRHWRREGLSVAPRRVRKRIRTGNSVGELVAGHPNAI